MAGLNLTVNNTLSLQAVQVLTAGVSIPIDNTVAVQAKKVFIGDVAIGQNNSVVMAGWMVPLAVLGFVVQPYHKKAFRLWLGDLDLSAFVTSVSGSFSADSAFFNVVVAGLGLADDITARANDAAVLSQEYVNTKTGLVEDAQEILQADFELLDWHKGAVNSSINISARGLYVPGQAKQVAVNNVFYASNSQVRLPFNNDIDIGDTVNHPQGSIVVANVSFTVGQSNEMILTA